MKRILILALTLASFACAVPKMYLPQDSFDFGFVPQNAKVSHTFWIKSVGDDSLKILKVRPGCGCTKAPLEKDEIAAGDSTQLEIIYSTGKRVGTSTKRPSITTNEGPPDKRITITAQAIRRPDSTYPVVIHPYQIIVSRLKDIDLTDTRFKVTNISDENLDMKLVSQPAGYFTLELPEIIAAGSSAECRLIIRPEHTDEEFAKSLTVEFSDPSKTRFSIPVVRRIMGTIQSAANDPAMQMPSTPTVNGGNR